MTRQTASRRRLAITVIAFAFSQILLSASTAHAATAALSAAAAEAAAVDAAAVSAAASTPEFLWFEQHVGSRCFSPPDARWQLDDSTRETLLHRQTQFFGVYEQPEGFYYHYSTLTKQTELSTVQDVKLQATKLLKQSSSYRCQYGVRRSTKAVQGICYPSDASGVPYVDTAVPWPFTVYAATLKLTGPDTLQQTLTTLPAYEDLLAATPTGVKPGRQETVITYVLDSSSRKVAISTKVNAFDVDPVSGEGRYVGTQEPGEEHQVPCTHHH